MKKTVAFGELLLKLQPEGYFRFTQSDKFCFNFTGTEANVLVSLSSFGLPTTYVTKLPDNQISDSAINSLRKFGVNTDNIKRGGERIGIFFCEKGASQRAYNVIYDRKHTSISTATLSDFNFEEIFKDANWFHLTGITPALSENLVEVCLHALKTAKKMGLTISFDINYRSKLWDIDKAKETIKKLLPYVDYCKDLFWYEEELTPEQTAKKMIEDFNLKGVFYSLRNSKTVSEQDLSGVFCTKEGCYYSKKYSMQIVDRIGGGDAFSAGIIYALQQGFTPQKTIDFAVGASCLSHSIEGDFNLVSAKEVESLLNDDGSYRAKR